MFVCLFVVWLIEWKLKLLKVAWEGIKGLSQTFILVSYLHEFKFISLQNPRVKIIWLLPFKEMKRGLKWYEFHLRYSNIETLSNSMSSWEKIKWLLQMGERELEIQRNNLKVTLKLFETYFFHLKLFELPNFKSSKDYSKWEKKYDTSKFRGHLKYNLAKGKHKRNEIGLKFKFKSNWELFGFL